MLCITVADTGIGIRPEAIPTLFDAFIRADLTSHRYIEGTGLGLAIVKKLTELMGGTVHVESAYGVGSTFAVELPQTIATAPEAPTWAARSFLAPEGRILVVDDSAENLAVIRSLLERTQLQVDTVPSGTACVEAVREKAYHLILMDYMMPDMDGIQTLEKLRAIPGFSTPVIALTANAGGKASGPLLHQRGNLQGDALRPGFGKKTGVPRAEKAGPQKQERNQTLS